MGEPKNLWGGRFTGEADAGFVEFNRSFGFDRRLFEADVRASIAHCGGLRDAGVITGTEAEAIENGLRTILARGLADEKYFADPAEDVHSFVEARLIELIGDVGGKLHTGRSRNDQVALDMRLYVRREGRVQAARIHELQTVLLRRAEEAADVYLPGYTHLQRAQPVLLSHHLLAHFWSLGRDLDRWRDCLARADVSPLGAGALAGSSLPLDPEIVANELGFAAAFDNSLDAVSDRDFVAEALFVVTLTQVHLSRIGEEIVLWSSEEFGFLRLADAFSTGSSMLPQKKNPDIAELARGKAGRLIGNLTGFLATLKGLPLAYNRDLQEDKEALFDTLDACARSLLALSGLLATAEFVDTRMTTAADDPMSAATDLAEHLVEQGTPFREAHAIVGRLVRQAVERGVPLDELVSNDPNLGPDCLALLEPGRAVRQRTTPGGAGPEAVARQLASARDRLAHQQGWLDR